MSPARRLMPLWGSVVGAIISALLPEVAGHWLHWPPNAVFVVWVGAPVVFVASAICAYYFSGKRKISLLIWLLAPFAFLNILRFVLVALLWTVKGGGV